MITTTKKTDKSKQEQIVTEKHYIGIDSGNGFLKAFSDKGLSAKASSYIYAPKADTENNIVDKEGCSVLYSPGVKVDLKGKLEIAQLDKGKVDYALHLLLSAIGCMRFRETVWINYRRIMT